MNKQFNTKTNAGGAVAFQKATPTIDYSNRESSKLKRRVQSINTDEKLISEEELFQQTWQC